MKLIFPGDRPDSQQAAATIWSIQQNLLTRAETMFGPRDSTKRIYQPVFGHDVPHLVNTPTYDGAFVALSEAAAGYWPTVVYEMAHETVHLLDPVAGITTRFEEGVAVGFSIEMVRDLTNHPMFPEIPSYVEAYKLMQSLPVTWNNAAMIFRKQYGRMSLATPESLRLIFPEADTDVLAKLAQPFNPY